MSENVSTVRSWKRPRPGRGNRGLLRRLAESAETMAAKQGNRQRVERCELCAEPLPAEHRHLLETSRRRVACACDACAGQCEGGSGGRPRFQLIPRDARALPDFQLTAGQWESLALPIDIAFFFRSTPAARIIALYPGPGGAVESLLTFETWDALGVANPVLREMRPDVEALLVNRVGGCARCYLAPIDKCFQLVGLIRLDWRGFSGGSEMWNRIRDFFAALDLRVRPGTTPRAEALAREVTHA